MPPETIRALVDAYFTQLQAMNPQAWAENFTEDALIYDPVGNPPSKPRENAEEFFSLLTLAFKDLQLSQDHVFINSNQAAVKWTMRAEGKSGKRGIAEGISVFVMRDDKIQQVSSYWDDKAMMAQIRG
ncbi:nuclear transport factor 2 family protein [Leptolyngbya sp. 7M]|uniref:nuclear transport factor 2 family protein n=1 Tax=Leptolyngbya sp. 7M TaxID=2812896 RepID=UPI001B8BE691|nr:nuclear transport factor 2 family protein [Leptolyngbya sp. 7M]QYO62727.1 nuclear transport factor 2 family protein [Leptolyngbya sp. 7M]